ncbi:MAG TPA: hypothetical protein VGF54_02005 [Streptosporangiaceae bacterium]|jgi:hypothetical protein
MADGRSQSPEPPNGGNEQPTRQQWFPWAAAGGSRRAGGGSRRVLLVTLAVCLCVAAAGVSVAVLSSPGGQAGRISAANSTPTSNAASGAQTQPGQPTAPTSRGTTGPKVTSQGVVTPPLGWPSQLNHQMLHWKAGPGGTTLNAVEQHMGSAMQAAGVKLYASMKLACASLASDVGTAQAGPPIPYAAMQRLYATALTGLSGAAANCRSAISEHPSDETTAVHVNQALLDQARLEFAAMSKKLYRATAQIQSAHR